MRTVASFSATEVDAWKLRLLQRERYLKRFALWPPRDEQISIERWLSNFGEEDMPFALSLAEGFSFFSERMMDELWEWAFQQASMEDGAGDLAAKKLGIGWKELCDQTVFTFPTDEVAPNVSDSGHNYVRQAKRRLGIEDSQLVDLAGAARCVLRGAARCVVLLDDFSGTGNQLVATLKRAVDVDGAHHSLLSLAKAGHCVVIPCVSIATGMAMKQIALETGGVTSYAGLVLSGYDSVFGSESRIWPPGLADAGLRFLHRVSTSVGIPDYGGTKPGDWRGFGGLGLLVAHHGGVPDATLPLLTWTAGDWRPLLRSDRI